PDSHASRRFSSRSSFQNVASFRKVVLEDAGEVCMTRTRRIYGLMFLRIAFCDRQRFLPVLPVTIFDGNGNWRANRDSIPHTRQDVRRIAFDLHPSTATITLLSPP